MIINVKFFAAAADMAGTRSIEVELEPGDDTARAIKRILSLYPRLAGENLIFAVNAEYASGEQPLRMGDELAVFTPVSGG